ncbi:MAG: peptide chain release factor N(5)-glutamine methyltransferase [Pelagibacterales bacterium]|nr:peptide chain release factor N(5)-glutamine methyltransferase [Pelagibacterales bacterium]
MDYRTILNQSSNLLKNFNIKSARLDSELLLSSSLKISRESLLLNLNREIKPNQQKKFKSLLEKRTKKVPVAYILGYKDFWKSKFLINRSVLIPRPDTELIVEEALNYLPKDKYRKILDIGTGSGSILISILLERLKSNGVGLDISKNAIKIAKINAKLQHVHNRITFVNTDVDKYNLGKYDLVVSNPPYIKRNKISRLEEDVKNFEPKLALDGGYDGYSKIEKVIEKSSNLLKRKGNLILEIGYDQGYCTSRLLERCGFFINKISKDLSKKDRCIVSTKH